MQVRIVNMGYRLVKILLIKRFSRDKNKLKGFLYKLKLKLIIND